MVGIRTKVAAATILAIGLIGTVVLGSTAGAQTTGYTVTKLVSDRAGVAATTDPNLVNAWGLAAGPQTFWWSANNGSNTSTLYDGTGAAQPLIVRVKGAPTGTVFNGGTGFQVSDGTTTASALFLFASESGTIRGWSPTVGTTTPPSTKTEVVVDRSSRGAIYKGLAIATTTDGDRLYATDFHHGRVDVFDETFHRVKTPGAFQDPNLPERFAPFGIANINGDIVVTYAKQDADAEDEVDHLHLGYVDMFDTSGTLLGRVATRGSLDAPWGLALAPASFGPFSGDLLVGNFGNGRIHAYDLSAMGGPAPVGTMKDDAGDPITIDGLWGLAFGNDANAGPSTTLYFTAGPQEESHGLFGMIEAPAP